MEKLYQKIDTKLENPEIEGYYDTDKGEIYFYFEGWCSNEARPESYEYPKYWLKEFIATEKIKKSKSKKPQLTPEQLEKLPGKILEYNSVFPEKTKIPTSDKIARSSPRELIDAFTWFILNHPQYSWDIILKATEEYISEYRKKGWNYMRTSQYFVRKQNVDKTWNSDLGNYCQMVLDGHGGEGGENEETFTGKIV